MDIEHFLGAAALIAYIRSPDKFFLFLFLAVIILLDFYMAYGMDFLRNRKARKLASMQGEYEIEISDRQIVYREGKAKIKYSGAKIKWFRSDHVYVLNDRKRAFCTPQKNPGSSAGGASGNPFFKNYKRTHDRDTSGKERSIWDGRKSSKNQLT